MILITTIYFSPPEDKAAIAAITRVCSRVLKGKACLESPEMQVQESPPWIHKELTTAFSRSPHKKVDPLNLRFLQFFRVHCPSGVRYHYATLQLNDRGVLVLRQRIRSSDLKAMKSTLKGMLRVAKERCGIMKLRIKHHTITKKKPINDLV